MGEMWKKYIKMYKKTRTDVERERRGRTATSTGLQETEGKRTQRRRVQRRKCAEAVELSDVRGRRTKAVLELDEVLPRDTKAKVVVGVPARRPGVDKHLTRRPKPSRQIKPYKGEKINLTSIFKK